MAKKEGKKRGQVFSGDSAQRRYLLRSMLTTMLNEQDEHEPSLVLVVDPRGELRGNFNKLRKRLKQE